VVSHQSAEALTRLTVGTTPTEDVMIGSTHPIISVEIARADIAARIRKADERAAAAEMRREQRTARVEARRARRSASRAAGHRRPVRHFARFTHGSPA
jgi:hypothetical protein